MINKKVLLVDDHPLILNGLKALLDKIENINVIGAVQNGMDALSFLKKKSVDVIICDFEMPEMDGFELITRVNNLYPHIQVVILSMHNEQYILKNFFKLNVNAILSKSAEEDDFRKVFETLEKGENYFDKIINKVLVDAFKTDMASLKEGKNRNKTFSKKEIEVLKYVYEGLTSKEIAELTGKSVNTIDTHRRNMYAKSSAKNIADLIKFAIDMGYLVPKKEQKH